MLTLLVILTQTPVAPSGPIFTNPATNPATTWAAGDPVPLSMQCTGQAPPLALADQPLTFTRASSAYCERSDGLVVALTSDQPRLERDGLRIEGPATNAVTSPRDLTDVAWTASNVTVTKTATGADGVENAASALTATSSDGTVLQTITAGSAQRATSFFIRRRTGSGAISVTTNNGSTWTAITTQLTTSWKRVRTRCSNQSGSFPIFYLPNCMEASTLTRTAANQVIGIKISTSGDAIDVDFAQNELNDHATSPVAGFTRAEDIVQFASLSSLPVTSGEVSVDWSTQAFIGSNSERVAVIDTNSFGGLAGSKGVAWYVNTNGTLLARLINSSTGTSQLTPSTYPSFPGLQLNQRFSWGSGNWFIWRDGIVMGSVEDGSAKMPDGHLHAYIGERHAVGGNDLWVEGWVSRVRFKAGAVGDFYGSERNVTLVGDSIVDGTLVHDGFKPQQLLQTAVKRSTERYVTSVAVSGYTVDQCVTAWNGTLASIILSGSAAKAHSLMLWQCGINSLGDASLWTKAQAALENAIDAGVNVVPSTITPCSTCTPGNIEAFNSSMRSWCTTQGVTCADTYAAMNDGAGGLPPAYDSGDHQHPSDQGTAVMANTWCAAGACR